MKMREQIEKLANSEIVSDRLKMLLHLIEITKQPDKENSKHWADQGFRIGYYAALDLVLEDES